MCPYYFLEVTLTVLNKEATDVAVNYGKFVFYIKEALKEVFGQIGSDVNFDILKFEAGKSIIRCPSNFFVKFRGALTLFGRHNSNTIAFNVLRSSPCLISFVSNSATYKHVTSG